MFVDGSFEYIHKASASAVGSAGLGSDSRGSLYDGYIDLCPFSKKEFELRTRWTYESLVG